MTRRIQFSPLADALALLSSAPADRVESNASGTTGGPAVNAPSRGTGDAWNASSARVADIRVARPLVVPTTKARPVAAERTPNIAAS